MRVLDFVRLLRPQFLIAGLALNILGTAVALHLGAAMDWAKFSLFQTVIWSSQIAGACANELADVASDKLNENRTWFSGGSGMLVSGRVHTKTVVNTLLLSVALALAASLPIVLDSEAGIQLLLIVVVGLSLAVSYSLRPLRASYRGLGEILMAFMVSFLTPVASFYVMFGGWGGLIVPTTLPIVFQLLGLMVVVEFPDVDADRIAGKRNLVVRMGKEDSWWLGVLTLALGGVSALIGVSLGLPSSTGIVTGLALLTESLLFFAIGRIPESRSRTFWSTAISCGFYVCVILLIAGTLLLAD